MIFAKVGYGERLSDCGRVRILLEKLERDDRDTPRERVSVYIDGDEAPAFEDEAPEFDTSTSRRLLEGALEKAEELAA